jgi:hypothetical protein
MIINTTQSFTLATVHILINTKHRELTLNKTVALTHTINNVRVTNPTKKKAVDPNTILRQQAPVLWRPKTPG